MSFAFEQSHDFTSSAAPYKRRGKNLSGTVIVKPRQFLVQNRGGNARQFYTWTSTSQKWFDDPCAIKEVSDVSENTQMTGALDARKAIEPLTVIGLLLLAVGLVLSLSIGVTRYSIVFPIGAFILFVAYHIDRVSGKKTH